MKKIISSVCFILACIVINAQPVITQEHKTRAAELVSRMTLEEKIEMISGKIDKFHTYEIERLGIPTVRLSDGPQGFRFDSTSTVYPCGMSVAAMWNRAAAYNVGKSLAYGAKARGIQVMLGPGVNIYRAPLCGRNYEYYGEDPYLASETALQYILGMQQNGVMSTIKHFALNNQEYERHMVDSDADERTINEIYFPTFRKAVEKGRVGAVMTSYNRVNGIHASENPWLIGTLRSWGHEGIIMSDWRSCYSTLNVIKGGLDLEMPRNDVLNYERIKPLLDNGMVYEWEIDAKCQHILQTFIAYGFYDNPAQDTSFPVINPECDRWAYEAALEGPVLLKNDGILPIRPSAKNRIVLMGPNSDRIPHGGGSGSVSTTPEREITMREGLGVLGKKYQMIWLENVDSTVIKSATAVVMAMGYDETTERENRDRTFNLPAGQDSLINEVLKYNTNVIVVINSGGEVSLEDWGDKVSAVIMGWYPGQHCGTVMAEIISGKVSPSGRLPFTFWGSWEGNPVSKFYHPVDYMYFGGRYRKSPYTEYREGLFLGYKAVEYFKVKPQYAFGYGLTYSEFEYSDLTCEQTGDTVKVSFTLKNVGPMEASEVAQVYVCPKDPSIIRPDKELKGFEKVKLAKGESRRVIVELPAESFSYYDTATHAWVVDRCGYDICVGRNAEDFVLKEEIRYL